MSALTPQDNARSSYAQAQPSRHVFQVNPPNTNPSPSQIRATSYSRPQPSSGLRPNGGPQHQSPYSTPYTNSPVSAVQNGTSRVSAEQQIAQGALSQPNPAGNVSTPQRRPPPLGTTIHMGNQHNGLIEAVQNLGAQRQAMNTSPAVQNLGSQRQSMNGSPAQNMQQTQRPSMNNSPVTATQGLQTQFPESSPGNTSQDMSMIDPQLAEHSPSAEQPANDGSLPAVASGEMLSPPPGGSYPTFEALFAAAQAHALSHGYAFVIGRSKRDNRGLKKVFLICDRGGINKEKVPGEQRQRKTKSRKCGCEFGVFGLEGKTAWLLRGRIDGEHLTHNHPPSESPTEHPGARKLDAKAIAAVKALEENGVSVKETLEILHAENPTVKFLPRDIYNARAAIKRDPSRVEASATDSLPTFYKKPPMTFEERLRAELRTEVANAHAEVEKVKEQWQSEVESLKAQLREKDKVIQKFEMFIDICNERVMVQRERLAGGTEGVGSD
ncbi:hypothetical protein BP5796_05341 [Coleophoma crateriformis]|uniref:FAR1 domain-containing protein n=1 Tax=Coleophoma crateriformis TaxID=565419 RepID=A0A3D8S2W3_9HELO|nr:hypothetical protein BP5796_05341 [Coleophoma crateriformis]